MGINLRNNDAAATGDAQNSPALTFSSNSWNPDDRESQPVNWSIHGWGFSTSGTAGDVLTFTVQRPDPVTISPVAFDEAGRVLLGYTKLRSGTYYGFAGEDFGEWNVILAGRTVVGWPQNGVVSELHVTGNTILYKGLNVGGNLSVSGTDILKTIMDLQSENQVLKDELCRKDNTYSWC